ncbi:MAG: ATP--guanido phosphotransferase [Clostridia bacterium]|nr:ATP--guanido phosphotransferase [Clostridia bacterium]
MNDYTVISSRVRFARNLQGFRFPSAMGEEEAERATALVLSALQKRGLTGFYMRDLPETVRRVLLEQDLISKELYSAKRGAVATAEDDKFSVMVLEEDCLRLAVVEKGLTLRSAYDRLSQEEVAISSAIPFAFDKNFGYLTACVTNLGTGMRASVMLFLPALERAGKIPSLCQELSAMGLTVRGVLGEGTDSEHSVYQVSNAKSLGVTEEEIIAAVTKAALQLSELELSARRIEFNRFPHAVENRVKRAEGMLRSATLLSYGEMMQALSAVKEGVSLGILLERGDLDDLTVAMRPAHVEALAGKTLSREERDFFRAEYVRKIFTK